MAADTVLATGLSGHRAAERRHVTTKSVVVAVQTDLMATHTPDVLIGGQTDLMAKHATTPSGRVATNGLHLVALTELGAVQSALFGRSRLISRADLVAGREVTNKLESQSVVLGVLVLGLLLGHHLRELLAGLLEATATEARGVLGLLLDVSFHLGQPGQAWPSTSKRGLTYRGGSKDRSLGGRRVSVLGSRKDRSLGRRLVRILGTGIIVNTAGMSRRANADAKRLGAGEELALAQVLAVVSLDRPLLVSIRGLEERKCSVRKRGKTTEIAKTNLPEQASWTGSGQAFCSQSQGEL